jgi:hypothetical protein
MWTLFSIIYCCVLFVFILSIIYAVAWDNVDDIIVVCVVLGIGVTGLSLAGFSENTTKLEICQYEDFYSENFLAVEKDDTILRVIVDTGKADDPIIITDTEEIVKIKQFFSEEKIPLRKYFLRNLFGFKTSSIKFEVQYESIDSSEDS